MAYPGILRRVLEHIAEFAVHGAVSAATAGRIALRDAAGRMQAADPSADLDVVNKRTLSGSATLPSRKINTTPPLGGGGDLSADRTLSVALATTSAAGVVQLATAAEAAAGTDTTKAVTPAGLVSALGAAGGGAATPQSDTGVGQWASLEIVKSGLSFDKLKTPSGGTWAYFYVRESYAVGDVGDGQVQSVGTGAGVAAGGSTVYDGDKNSPASGFCWRVN